MQIHEEADDGDVLIFLPGQEEIEDLASLLKRHLEKEKELQRSLMTSDIVQPLHGIGTDLTGKAASIVNGVMICVLYAALPPEQQMMAFAPKPAGCSRKIILATNIAETSGKSISNRALGLFCNAENYAHSTCFYSSIHICSHIGWDPLRR